MNLGGPWSVPFGVPFTPQESLDQQNLRLSEIEFQRQHLYLRSLPRLLGLVLGNTCNIDCLHCYQAKNSDNLLKPPEIAMELRREFQAFYPFISTLRVQGGEVFAYAGFGDLIEDVRVTVTRPILSTSTNGTLIDECWAERIVRTPFRNVTVSIDGGTDATYARLRRGARLKEVLANVARINRWKRALASEMPYLDSFFVVMRSNFRELPEYFRLIADSGFSEVSLQTMEVNAENSSREPVLLRDEVISDAAEVRELHAILSGLLPTARRHLGAVRTSGFTSLFSEKGLDTGFLKEGSAGLYPDSIGMLGDSRVPEERVSLCPNPWSTLFVAENGDVHLCFLSEPVGNLYQAPLISIWNSPAALAKRSRMISGRYIVSGCSARWCSWRDGKKAADAASVGIEADMQSMKHLADRAVAMLPLDTVDEKLSGVAAVRRQLAMRERSMREMHAILNDVCDTNREIHENGRKHVAHLESKAAKAVADYEALEEEFRSFRSWRIIRLALALIRLMRLFSIKK
ncbi:MAG: radical SAM protein [Bryobacteraceae bacterium]